MTTLLKTFPIASTGLANVSQNIAIPKQNVVSANLKDEEKSSDDTNVLLKYLDRLSVNNRTNISITPKNEILPWSNNLKKLFNENKAVIWAINARSFGAKDNNNDGFYQKEDVVGNFYNGVEKLPELKERGINCIHVLPAHKPGIKKAMGQAGSLYAPAEFLDIDEMLGGKEGFKYFIDEAHKQGIHVMLDLPSCSSIDFFEQNPQMMAFEKNGMAKTPKGWNDIRMFNPWADETKRILNPYLLDMHKKYVDMCIELGVDGIRADVSRAKPTEFWDTLIHYSHEKDPSFGWLAETYTYEDASPQLNMPYDRPMDAWRSGFDLIYGQWHLYGNIPTAKELHNYVIENLQASNRLPKGKSMLGSFATHDDVSPMFNGGADYCMHTSVVQSFLPMNCPYMIDGFEVGDWYVYPYTEKQIRTNAVLGNETKMDVHPGKMDIFNLCRPAKGDHPEIGQHLSQVMKCRDKYIDLVTHGSYIPLNVDGNDQDKIYTFARHLNGKTLIVIANKDVNFRQEGFVEIPGLKKDQKLTDICPSYGEESSFQADENGIKVSLGKARAHVFEVDTPDIEISGLGVYRQNLGKIPTN